MFNNRFNSSKNDPLIEAVKAARADGDTRRLAESMANDLFGVFSRQAVVREHLSDYDFALEEAYKCMKEEDKMADKDYDKDGKVETSKKEVWGSRLRAAKASGKYKGPVDEDSSSGLPPSDVAKQAGAAQQAQTPKSTPAPTRTKDLGSTFSSARGAAGMNEEQIDELTKPTGKTAMMALHRAERSDDETNDYTRTNRLFNWKQKHLPGKSARNQKDTGKAELPDYSEKDSGYVPTVKKSGKLTKSTEKATKAEIKSRLGKHTKPKHLPEESIDEAAYSAKAARAGKDIGKPGKMFSKIAAKAGEKYGSEEKGKKVAGAILAKIRAKHMKEDSSFKSAQVIEANAFDLGKTVPDASMKIRGGAYPSVAARLKDMAGIVGRGLARGFGNPVSAGALIAAEPTPANAGENEFARQAKYGSKPTTPAPKPAAAPNAGTPKPAPVPAAPKPAALPTPTPAPTTKSGFYKGGSQGDTIVKSGQTLSGIAKSKGLNVADLAKMNNISDVNKISAGAKLMTKVPTPPSRPADVSSANPSTPAPPAPKPAEPEFKGRMIPPSDSGVGATPPAASFVGSRKEMRSGGPATAPLTSKDFGRQPPSSMQESVQVGANKYRIV